MPCVADTFTFTIRITIRPRASHVYSIRSTRFLPTASVPAMRGLVRQAHRDGPVFWAVSPWRRRRTRCTAGQAIPAFDFYLAPYVRLSYIEEIKVMEQVYGGRLFPPLPGAYRRLSLQVARRPDGRGTHQAAGHQPYGATGASVDGGLYTQHECHTFAWRKPGRVQLYQLWHRYLGPRDVVSYARYSSAPTKGWVTVDGHFPYSDMEKKRGVSYLPTDRNYDLYCYACRVTARRFFPNFLNLDAPFNRHESWRADDPREIPLRGGNDGGAAHGFLRTVSERRPPSDEAISRLRPSICRESLSVHVDREPRGAGQCFPWPSSTRYSKWLPASWTTVTTSRRPLSPSSSRC